MPAEIESMASVREVPWHGIGTIVENAMTAEEAIQEAGLDWEVELKPLKAYMGHDARPQYVPVASRSGVVRTSDNEVLGVVGDNYVPFQNREAFTFFDNLVDSGEAKYETAGSLRGGKWVWLTARFPQTMQIGGIDPHDLYLLLSTSHDGSRAITASVTMVRVVCTNTLNVAIRGAKRRWSVRHVTTAKDRFREARDALEMTFRYTGTIVEQAEELLRQEFTDEQFRRLAEELIPDTPRRQSKIDVLRQAYNESPNLDNIRGTRWAAFNAVSEYSDWLKGFRTEEAQVLSIWDGGAQSMKDKALTLLR
jgi:phage/plasmid-like protein (TIGR03299 family)